MSLNREQKTAIRELKQSMETKIQGHCKHKADRHTLNKFHDSIGWSDAENLFKSVSIYGSIVKSYNCKSLKIHEERILGQEKLIQRILMENEKRRKKTTWKNTIKKIHNLWKLRYKWRNVRCSTKLLFPVCKCQ